MGAVAERQRGGKEGEAPGLGIQRPRFESQLCPLGAPAASFSSSVTRGQRIIYLPLAAERTV